MSREKQIEEIAEITSRDCGNCSECEYVGLKGDGVDCVDCVDCIDYFFANTIYNAGYRKQEWISVNERLPTWEDGKVLVFTNYGFSICERTTSNRWMGKHANWITHWMPLPEPPKGE